MRLRAPGLSRKTSCLPSLCICLHSAQNILRTYLQLYQPVIRALAKNIDAQDSEIEKLSMPVATTFAVTWRQVRRIMLSAFIVVYAYWHGEMLHTDAGRYMAMSRLLLECPRRRWGDKLGEAVLTLIDISKLANFDVYKHMQILLPEASPQFLRPLCNLPQPTIKETYNTEDYITDQTEINSEAFLAAGWSAMCDSGASDWMPDSNLGAAEDQTLFSLWADTEFPMEYSAWHDAASGYS